MLEKTHQIYLANLNKDKYENTFYFQEIETPIGTIIVIADDNYLYFCSFENSLSSKPIEKLLKTYSAKLKFERNTITEITRSQLNKYFNKDLTNFSIPIKLTGTDFQKQVWQALQRIPYGKTISYLDEAKDINKPKAFRAVANANGKNLFSIIVPCHRVLNNNGKIGGYTGGIEKKVFLLKLENSNF